MTQNPRPDLHQLSNSQRLDPQYTDSRHTGTSHSPLHTTNRFNSTPPCDRLTRYFLMPDNEYFNTIRGDFQYSTPNAVASRYPFELIDSEETINRIEKRARSIIHSASSRQDARNAIHPPVSNLFEAWISEYSLDTQEGIILMGLAECFLRIDNTDTAFLALEDALLRGQWEKHIGRSPSTFVNSSTFAFLLGSETLNSLEKISRLSSFIDGLVHKFGAPVLVSAVRKCIEKLGDHFVCADTIENAVEKSQNAIELGYSQSFDMLGEAALTFADADRYFESYLHAIDVLRETRTTSFTTIPGISIKLSALDPRYEIRHWPECHKRLYPRLRALCEKASEAEIPITLDAEESHRLEMQLLLMSQLMGDIPFKSNYEMGIAIQAYQKRAIPAIDYLIRSAEKFGRTLHIRLVKGAYWDTEIKSAQQNGLAHYPVFINKRNTDLNYLLCAKKLLAHHDLIYPQFATHNPVSIAAVLEYSQAIPAQMPTSRRFEFQKLYGMGDLFMQYLKTETPYTVRAYTPVGRYRELLPYLVRRLLENGVNSSILGAFHRGTINSQTSSSSPVTVRHPLVLAQPKKVLDKPADLYKPYRKNSPGVNLSCLGTLNQAYEALNQTAHHATTFQRQGLMATSILNGEDCHGPSSHVKYSPIDSSLKLGTCGTADVEIVETALLNAQKAYEDLRTSKLSTRCNLLSVFAEALHQHREELSHLAALETGKCIFDSLNEIREAIDFCYYYGQSAANVLVTHPLPHTAGEQNKLGFRGKGVVLCISPWNFPIAIFIGQIIAALVSGNAVIAKPASNAVFLAHRIIKILQGAGLPDHWVQLVLAPGNTIFDTVIPSPQISGVAFTGSFDVAREINIALATRRDSLVPLIAETGGLNAMMVDSSALPEQVIQDTLHSAFNCAGQRCSALRILLVPQQQLKLYETTLIRAMDTLRVDSPLLTETDIGPVIDRDAFTSIQRYIRHEMSTYNVHQVELQKHSPNGHYIAPTLMMCPDLKEIHKEVFGPVLHLVPYDESKPEPTIATLNKKGFSLTFGIHSRIKSRIRSVIEQINAGNIYVNRNIVGAVVGSQPFGGFGKSGTGTKAGGPHYLLHFVNEIAESVNINASGGDPGLFNQYE